LSLVGGKSLARRVYRAKYASKEGMNTGNQEK